jgi:hypothetical protein
VYVSLPNKRRMVILLHGQHLGIQRAGLILVLTLPLAILRYPWRREEEKDNGVEERR